MQQTWQKRWLVLRKNSSKGYERLEKFCTEKDVHLHSKDFKTFFFADILEISTSSLDKKPSCICLILRNGENRKISFESGKL